MVNENNTDPRVDKIRTAIRRLEACLYAAENSKPGDLADHMTAGTLKAVAGDLAEDLAQDVTEDVAGLRPYLSM